MKNSYGSWIMRIQIYLCKFVFKIANKQLPYLFIAWTCSSALDTRRNAVSSTICSRQQVLKHCILVSPADRQPSRYIIIISVIIIIILFFLLFLNSLLSWIDQTQCESLWSSPGVFCRLAINYYYNLFILFIPSAWVVPMN